MAAIEMRSVSFRTLASKLKKLDKLAEAQNRDRSFILNEAIDQYLDVQEYHLNLIEQGMREAEAGQLISHEEVGRRLSERRGMRKAAAS